MGTAEQRQPNNGYHIKLGAAGRMVMPAAIRQRHHMQPGDTLIIRTREGAVEVRTRSQIVKEAQAHFASLAPAEQIWSEELIQERRREAAAEASC